MKAVCRRILHGMYLCRERMEHLKHILLKSGTTTSLYNGINLLQQRKQNSILKGLFEI